MPSNAEQYFNTTHVEGRELRELEGKAKTQAERILTFFAEASQWFYTPSEVCTYVFKDLVPLTSVRRAMTVLSNEGKLIKTDRQRLGRYGRHEHCWRRKLGTPAQQELVL